MDIVFYSRVKHSLPLSALKKNIEQVLYSLKKKNASMSVHIIGDTKMTELNFRYRGKKKPTDVLSFGTEEKSQKGMPQDLGDLFICLPQVKRQAKEYSISWQEEFYRMLIHGILHLLGHDHMEEKEAKKMFSLQEKLLSVVWK